VAERLLVAADRADDGHASVDSDAHVERARVQPWAVRRDARVQRRQLVEDREGGAGRPDRVVFVRARIPEIGENTVARVLCDVAFEGADDGPARFLIRAHDVAQLFRIDLLRERRRAD